MKFTCVLIEADNAGAKAFEDFAAMLPAIEIAGVFKSVLEAICFFEKSVVDVVIAGSEDFRLLIQSVPAFMLQPPGFVCTSSVASDARICYEQDAIDYLQRPYSFGRFLKAVEKIQRRLFCEQKTMNRVVQPDHFFVKASGNYAKVELERLRYVEGLENYIRIHCDHRSMLTLCTMKNMEALLSAHRFLRIHRSYIVNMDRIEQLDNNTVILGDKALPIGKSYKKQVMGLLKGNNSGVGNVHSFALTNS